MTYLLPGPSLLLSREAQWALAVVEFQFGWW